MRCMVWILAGALCVVPASAAVFRVGVGAGCDQPSLAAALVAAAGSAGTDEIRLLAGASLSGPFSISGNPVQLRGGYASCGSASPVGTTELTAPLGSRPLTITSDAGGVLLSRLEIRGGDIAGDGGGLWIGGNGVVTLSEVLVTGNRSVGRGGSVFVDSTSSLRVDLSAGTVIEMGEAQHGGGIACDSPAVSPGGAILRLLATTAASGNIASLDGGGLHLDRGCVGNVLDNGPAVGLAGNTAGRHGGGAWIGATSRLHVGGFAGVLGGVRDNQAQNGGGAYVAGGRLELENGVLAGNTATDLGGGFYLAAGATALVQSDPSNPCAPRFPCTEISGNQARIGGGLLVSAGAMASLYGVQLRGNSAGEQAAALWLTGNGLVQMESIVFAGNAGPNLITVLGSDVSFSVQQLTVADNALGVGVFEIGAGVPFFQLRTTALAEAEPLFASYLGALPPFLTCVMSEHASAITGLPGGASLQQVVVDDPEFLDRASGDYRLRTSSPAIDYCPPSSTPSGFFAFDLEGDVREFDYPDRPSTFPGALRDLGADEVVPLFFDGFESGDTGGWDLTVE